MLVTVDLAKIEPRSGFYNKKAKFKISIKIILNLNSFTLIKMLTFYSKSLCPAHLPKNPKIQELAKEAYGQITSSLKGI